MNEDILTTRRITDAIARSYYGQGDGVLREFRLKVRRRVDLITITDKGLITIIEIKSSSEDFRSDKKWVSISSGLIDFTSVWATIFQSTSCKRTWHHQNGWI